MDKASRRRFLQIAGVAGAAAAVQPFSRWAIAQDKTKARVVVIGGGFAGSTCAKYIRRYDPSIEVTLIEPTAIYHTCPMSNAVLGGLKPMSFLAVDHSGLEKKGVKVVRESVTAVDVPGKTVTLSGGKSVAFDKLVVAPGIDFQWGVIEGYDEAASEIMPHAYRGATQFELLGKQLEAMPEKGTVIITAPADPYRCPPAPYERASMIAHFLKAKKPKAKVLILDAKEKFIKQPLFEAGWKAHYPEMIEWVPLGKGGKVIKVDTAKKTVETEAGEKHKGDVINVIPPQKAGAVAALAGVNEGSWCPVDQRTFESKKQKGVYVIGDASMADKMPKSGFAANAQGKVCAAAIVTEVNAGKMPEPSYANTCYSLVAPDEAISVAAIYHHTDTGIEPVKGAGGPSPADANAEFKKKEYDFAFSWYANIRADSFG